MKRARSESSPFSSSSSSLSSSPSSLSFSSIDNSLTDHTRSSLNVTKIRGLWKLPFCALLFARKRPADIQSPPSFFPLDPSFRVITLANGMRCYTKINHIPRQKAELRLIVKVGSMHENETQLGLAHFIEHLAFRQTKNFKDGEIIKYLERFGMAFGADLNASTGFDETIYQLTVPLDKKGLLKHAMRIMADWARAIEPTPKALATEKKIVLEEWREGQNSRARLMNASFCAKLAGSRYATRLPIGSPELIKNFTAEQCLEFFNQWYRPELMSFVAVGDFTSFDQVESLAQQILAPLVCHPSFPLTPTLPDRSVVIKPGVINFMVQRDPETTRCSVSVSILKPFIQLSPLEDIKDEMLTSFAVNIINSRLSKLIRRPTGAEFISASCDVSRYVKTLQVTMIEADCGANVMTILPSLEALLLEIYRFLVHGVSERELRICIEDRKSSYENTLLERHDLSSEDFVEDCVSDFVDNEPLLGVEYATRWGLAVLKSPTYVSVETVNNKVRELFDLSEKQHIFGQAVVVGESKEEDGEKDKVDNTTNGDCNIDIGSGEKRDDSSSSNSDSSNSDSSNSDSSNSSSNQIKPYKIKARQLQDVLERLRKASKTTTFGEWKDDIVTALASACDSEVDMSVLVANNKLTRINARELVFRNGLRVILKETDFEKDSIYLKGFGLRGTAQYSEDDKISYLEATMACPVAMETGYGPYPKEQIEELFAGKLANVQVDLTRDSRRVEGECSKNDFECMLQLLELLLTQQNITPRAWDLLKKRCHQQLAHQKKNPLFHFQKRLSELTTQGHYFYRPVRAEDVNAMQFERIKRIFFESFSDASQLCLLLTGSLPPLEKCISLLIRYLGSAQTKPLPSDYVPIHLRPLKTVVPVFPQGIVKDVIYFGLAAKSQIGLVFPLECPDHESVIVVLICEILNNVLLARLRRQMGGIYNLSVSTHKYSLLSLTATITILFSCEPTAADGLVDVMIDTISKLKSLCLDNIVDEIVEQDEEIKESLRKSTRVGSRKTIATEMSASKKVKIRKQSALSEVDSDDEGLSTLFVQAFRAVVANQRSSYQSSQHENGYWEDLIYNGCLMYHPEKGTGVPHPFTLIETSAGQTSSLSSPQGTCSPKGEYISSETKDSAVLWETSENLDLLLSERHRHVMNVVDELTLEKCHVAIQHFFPLDNYVLLKLMPAKLDDPSQTHKRAKIT